MVFRLILVGMVLIHNQSGIALVPRVAGHLPAALLLEGTCEPAAACVDNGPPKGVTEMALHLNREEISFGLATVPGPVLGLPSLCRLAARSAGTDPDRCAQGTGPALHGDCLTGNPSSCPVAARVRLPAVPTACHYSHQPLSTSRPVILTACSDLWQRSKLPVMANVLEYGFQKVRVTTAPRPEVTALPNAVILDIPIAAPSITLERIRFVGGSTTLTLKPQTASDGTKVVTVAVMNEPVAATGGTVPVKHDHFQHFYSALNARPTDPLVPMRTGGTARLEVGKCEPYLVCLDSIFEDRHILFDALSLSDEELATANLLRLSPPHNAQQCDVPTYP